MFLGVKILVQKRAKTIITALLTETAFAKFISDLGCISLKQPSHRRQYLFGILERFSHCLVQYCPAGNAVPQQSLHFVEEKHKTIPAAPGRLQSTCFFVFLSRLILACTRLSMSKANIIHSVGVAAQEDNDKVPISHFPLFGHISRKMIKCPCPSKESGGKTPRLRHRLNNSLHTPEFIYVWFSLCVSLGTCVSFYMCVVCVWVSC